MLRLHISCNWFMQTFHTHPPLNPKPNCCALTSPAPWHVKSVWQANTVPMKSTRIRDMTTNGTCLAQLFDFIHANQINSSAMPLFWHCDIHHPSTTSDDLSPVQVMNHTYRHMIQRLANFSMANLSPVDLFLSLGTRNNFTPELCERATMEPISKAEQD